MSRYSHAKMISWTVCAVLLTGAGVVASVLTPPSSVARLRKTPTELRNEASLVETVGDRSPASAEPVFSAVAIDEKGTQAVDFSLPCEGGGRFAKNIAQIRLSGKLCDHAGKTINDEIASSEIRNITNGFSATVFYPKSGAFTTDYMTLAAGENRIRILHILKTGERMERNLVIERR